MSRRKNGTNKLKLEKLNAINAIDKTSYETHRHDSRLG